MISHQRTRFLPLVTRFGFLPFGFYLVVFCLVTLPLITQFNTHYFGDTGDGIQNYWNLWWVNKAVTEIHQSPWHTNYVHYPHGLSLLGHTLNPFNGFVGILLLKFLTISKTYNVIVLFSYAMGGLTAFWLISYITQSYWSSLIGGGVFTFSNYHFAHTEGHMQLTSLEWVPLFILCWYILLTKPSPRIALGAAFVLFAVLLCDYYYFFYCVLAGLLMIIWQTWQKRDLLFPLRRTQLMPLLIFGSSSLLLCGPLVFSLLRLNSRDKLVGVHPATEYSLGLFTLFIPGGHWKFAKWTEPYWTRLPGNFHETSVHIGVAAFIIIVYVWWNRKRIRIPSLGLWYFVLVFFTVLSFGPVLHVWGKGIPSIPMPYTLLEYIIPPLRMSGVPIRMVVITVLSASVISAVGFQRLFSTKPRWAFALLIAMCFELLPRPIPTTRLPIPQTVNILKWLPGEEGLLDLVHGPIFSLYYQTIHQKPIAFGYVARFPSGVAKENRRIVRLIRRRRYGTLCRVLHFRYLLTNADEPEPADGLSVRALFKGKDTDLYDLGPNGECGNMIPPERQ